MNNCMFNDADLNINVKLASTIQDDRYGYYIDLLVRQKDIIPLMKLQITPHYNTNETFTIRVGISNVTFISFNGMKLDSLENPLLYNLDVSKLVLKQICLNRYSSKTRSTRDCYATRLIFKVAMK